MAHALVTGANRGIGLEFVRQLLARGERVVATCRHPGRALELTRLAGAHPGHLLVLPLTLPDTRSIAELVREIATLDLRIGLLVNNAGMLVEGERFGAIDAKALADSFATNAQGPFLLAQALAPRLAEGARVANLTSTLGSIGSTDSPYSPSYSISKAALNMASRLLALALEPRRAIVIALCPGWVRTDMGGANAPLGAPESVAAMLRVIDALKPGDSGSFLSERGHPIPW
ncbi:SDR family oxidoreductase [Dokdonella fugitiva]|uniref:SDR family oxidoreductase n=1 Tax=Dokdonella fugitiva TaxID=328517 RepID=UPI0015FD45EF|nr:SDR family oxidoreductase [Dokdonella fugitiva]MBA8882909.1 NAD(P)-dependent dehydrogenase (short-subunit alcohol dehydrogenase family) [Dokdonella fugitiva]